MASVSIASLPRGHEFTPARFSLSAQMVVAYTDAVEDANDYGENVPPLAVVALGLRALQNALTLPEGSLHTGQDVVHASPARCDEELVLTGRIAQRSERQGFVISVIEFEVAAARRTILKARTTIMAPV